MSDDTLALILYITGCAGVAGLFLALATFVGPKRPNPVKQSPFECGNRPHKVIRGKFSVKFFLVALLFILFDIELIFLFPWAVTFRSLGVQSFVSMTVFLAFVLAGLVYAWKRGALQWR
ncbi:MAG TPA: NADH-quinone oxidoreductase subunit A [Acidobacteriota bacterium]|jgi:NADH-quinone oxidoreductase subunit A|nr:NADH-quinone oxidoreductase subunit A [Acidobacteriota bacterium]